MLRKNAMGKKLLRLCKNPGNASINLSFEKEMLRKCFGKVKKIKYFFYVTRLNEYS
jgi:hypothetical protein